jgi:hypothetical protein
VALGLLSQKDADTALAQGMSLADLERKLNRDITGEGKIGDTSGLHGVTPLAPKRPGIWIPEEEYLKLSQKYPNVPGVFVPDEELSDKDAPTYHPIPMSPKERKNGANP